MSTNRWKLLPVLALLASACGGGSPFSPTALRDGNVSLRGTVLGGARASSAQVVAFKASAEAMTVTVKDTEISTEVGSDGSFTLRGLPEGGFTLIFWDADMNELGELDFDAVKANQEIIITVEVDAESGDVVLLEEQRNGIGHGDLEIQGNIDALVSINTSGDSELQIAGYTVIVRPGQTAIREGNTALTVDELSAGDQVHVKGVWLEPEGGASAADQQVLAHEIKLQRREESDDDDGDGDQKITICHKGKNTISISINAWPAHEAHGDKKGACGS